MDVNFLASIVKVSGDRGRYAEMGIKDGKEEEVGYHFKKSSLQETSVQQTYHLYWDYFTS